MSDLKTKYMKQAFPLLLLVLLSGIGCKKDNDRQTITGTVVNIFTSSPDQCVVMIDNPDERKQSFICDNTHPEPPAGMYNCRNSIIAMNLPANVKFVGTRISFRGYKDNGRNPIVSSNLVPHEVDVYNVTKIQ